MRKLRTPGSLMAAIGLAVSMQATAVPVTTTIAGSMDAQENGCGAVTSVLSATNCTWSSAPVFNGAGGWLGPTWNGTYYAAGAVGKGLGYTPVAGADGKSAISMGGTFTVDNSAGTVAGAIVLGAGQRNISTGNGPQGFQTWDSITQVLATTSCSSATANGSGGIDCVLGSKGAPGPLAQIGVPANDFTRDNAPDPLNTLGRPGWDCDGISGNGGTPCAVGIERSTIMGNNVGGTTTGAAVNNVCTSTSAGNADCLTGPIMWGTSARSFGWDNLILVLSTDGAGTILSADAYWTQEFKVAFGPTAIRVDNNSLQAGHFSFATVPIAPAVWLFGSCLGVMTMLRRKVT